MLAAGDGVHKSMTGTRFVGVSGIPSLELSLGLLDVRETLRLRPRLMGDDGDWGEVGGAVRGLLKSIVDLLYTRSRFRSSRVMLEIQ